MVAGIDKFRDYFAGHEDKYAIIGGSACDIIFDAVGVPFRATKDIDIVICAEVIDPGFARQFADFLAAGGYKAHERSEGRPQFHRFSKPADSAFSFMIELFSRAPEGLDLPENAHLAPIPVDDDTVSLSAILLDADYFAALLAFKRVEASVSVLDERLLIAFKAKAYLDLTERKNAGDKIDSKTIDRHMRDVFRLLQLLAPDERVILPEAIKVDMAMFVDAVRALGIFDPKTIGVKVTLEKGLDQLSANYELGV